MTSTEHTDVLICGAGPVGLLNALGLSQQSIDTFLIGLSFSNTIMTEKKERATQQMFGRAAVLYPRSVELLEQLHVTQDVLQTAFIARQGVTLKDGKRITNRGWHMVLPTAASSFHNYADNAIDMSLDDSYNITATITHISLGNRTVRCKYLVGADGAQSSVRQLAGVAMEGDETTYKWIRIDGKVKTDMPDHNTGFAAIEGNTHGTVLWLKLDGDAHRVGFAIPSHLQEKYPEGPNEVEVVKEAISAVFPFKLEVERVGWWTHCSIKQKVASTMQKDNYVLLDGDAAHTHSSGLAQGVNTGIHDATDLVWKMAGTLKGWYKDDVLSTYASERREIAKRLIALDKLVSATISGDIPAAYTQSETNPDEVLEKLTLQNAGFTTGLGIEYQKSIINKDVHIGNIVAGTRAEDSLIYQPDPLVPIRLHYLLNKENQGRWSILIFAGHASRNGVAGSLPGAGDAFNGPAIGKLYLYKDFTTHDRYGITYDNGGIVVVRPDGILAYSSPLDGLDISRHAQDFVTRYKENLPTR
ncbi:FAD binding domain-containing protein [Trichoderma compactum]